MKTLTMTHPPLPSIAVQIRQRYPAHMRRGEALALLRGLGFSRRTLESWCRSESGVRGIRRQLPGMKEFRYSREVIIQTIETTPIP